MNPKRESPSLPLTLGRYLFQARDYTAVPLILLLLLFITHRSAGIFWLGILFIILGEGLRLWAAGVIGEKSRTRSTEVFSLVTTGPYSLTRNPLYFGNLLLGFGFFLAAAPLWLIGVYLLFFITQYSLIVYFEEWNLKSNLGDLYEEYRKRVPRWIRIPFPRYISGVFSLRRALRSELTTLLGIVSGIGVLLILRSLYT